MQTDKDTLTEIFKLNTPRYFAANEVSDFIDYLDNYSATYLTFEHKVVGGKGYYVKETDKSGRITWMFFHPNYSGLGLGNQAVKYYLTTLKQNPNVEKLDVTTSQLGYKFKK